MTRLNKHERLRQILKLVNENPDSSVYSHFSDLSPKDGLYAVVSRYYQWGYLKRKKPGVYELTDKGRAMLDRLTKGKPHCIYCGSTCIRRAGHRNGDMDKQRFRCMTCGKNWTKGNEVPALVRSAWKNGESVFIITIPKGKVANFYWGLQDWVKVTKREYPQLRMVEFTV